MPAMAAVRVGTDQEMEVMINTYIAHGFVLANRTPSGATLFKKKEFSIVWAVVGFFLCLLPLLIYLIVYASQSDQTVHVQLASQPVLPASAPQAQPQLSSDGRWWWDGRAWQPVAGQQSASLPPPGAPGAEFQPPVPGTGTPLQ